MVSCYPWKKRLLLGIALALVLAGGTALLIHLIVGPEPDLTYQGKPLRDWSRAAARGDPDARAALQAMGPKAVPGLIWLLQHRDPFYQRWTWNAARFLPAKWSRMIRQRVKPPLSLVAREAAARSLGVIGPPAKDAAPALARALRETEGRLRWDAAETLARIGSNSVPSLVRALRGSNESARHGAAYAAGFLGPQAKDAVPALIRCLDDPSELVRQSSAYSLSQIGAPALLALIDATRHGNTQSSNTAAKTLAGFDLWIDPVAPLVELARDPDSARRQLAIVALGDFRPRALAASTTIIAALKDPAPPVRLAALKALARAGQRAKRALPTLIEGLEHESPPVREWSARVLGNLGAGATSAVPQLKRLIQDPTPAVRAAASEALARIPSTTTSQTSDNQTTAQAPSLDPTK
jgi:HEAT repeat protein